MKYPEIQEASLIQINGVSASEAANFPDSVKFIRKTQQKGLIPMSDYNLETIRAPLTNMTPPTKWASYLI